jgi:hypothetical protein
MKDIYKIRLLDSFRKTLQQHTHQPNTPTQHPNPYPVAVAGWPARQQGGARFQALNRSK